MTEKRKILLADCALLIAAICWGGGFIAADIAVKYFSPFFIMGVRFTTAAILTYIIFGRHIRRSGKEERKAGATLGGLFFLTMPVQVIALQYTTPSKQAFILASYAAMIPFVVWIIQKKRPKIQAVFAGILVVIGVGMISLNDALTVEVGDGLSLVFAVAYAVLVVLTGMFAIKCNPLGMSFYSYLTTGVCSLIAMLVLWQIPKEVPLEGILALTYLSVINTVVAYTLQNVAQRYTPATHAGIIISTESLFAFIFGIFLYGDPYSTKMLVGGLIVFAAVLVSEMSFGKKKVLAQEASEASETEIST